MHSLEALAITKLSALRPRLTSLLRGRQRADIITQQAVSIGVAVVVAGAALVAFFRVVGTVLDNYGAQLGNVGGATGH
jgi:hypothetical protein